MKIVQTFITGLSSKSSDKEIYRKSFGWLSSEYNLISWSLSCLLLKKHYQDVVLYTDKIGYRLLIEDLKLPYTDVVIINAEEQDYPKELWALYKLNTYAQQKETFLHVDGDVYVFDKIELNTNTDIICQNLEIDQGYYSSVLQQINTDFHYLPDFVKADLTNVLAFNMGVFGANNLSFVKTYCEEAKKFVISNINSLKNIDLYRYNAVFEQFIAFQIAREQKIDIQYLFATPVSDLSYYHLVKFNEVPLHRKYIHALGHFKKSEIVCFEIGNRLRFEWPEYYYRALRLTVTNGVDLFIKHYYAKSLNPKINSHVHFKLLQDKFKSKDYSFFDQFKKEQLEALPKNIFMVFSRTFLFLEVVLGRKEYRVISQLFNDMDFDVTKGLLFEFINDLKKKKIRERLVDLYLYESNYFNYTTLAPNLVYQYTNAYNVYSNITKVRNSHLLEMREHNICVFDNIHIYPSKWMWKVPYEKSFNDVIVKNQSTEPKNLATAFHFNYAQDIFCESSFDEITVQLINILQKSNTIDKSIQLLAQKFKKTELKNRMNEFEEMISNRIVLLIELGIITFT